MSVRLPVYRRIVASLCAWAVLLSSLLGAVPSHAQQAPGAPPTIEHDEAAFDATVAVQVFTATVQGNGPFRSVDLFHRFAGEDEYQRTPMSPVAGSPIYSASVSTPLGSDRPVAIEYYLRVEDQAGNLALKGFTFNPLVRELADPVAASSGTAAASESSGGRSRVLYYVLGALAIGAIAGLAGGSGGGSDDGDPGTDPGVCSATDGCLVTLTLGAP